MSSVYLDMLKRPWPTTKLDAMLSDPSVALTVSAALAKGVRPKGGWDPRVVLAWARHRYRREEAAALLLLLVTRFYDRNVSAAMARRGT